MATVLLSICGNTFCGSWMSVRFWHLIRTNGSPHIASSAYQKRPAWQPRIETPDSPKQTNINRTFKVWEWVEILRTPGPLVIIFTIRYFPAASYPEGNFGGNQLLGDSMSLSPLYPGVTSDLHVSTIGDPPPDFRLASVTPGKDRHLSGLSKPALDSSHPETIRSALRPGRRFGSNQGSR